MTASTAVANIGIHEYLKMTVESMGLHGTIAYKVQQKIR
mgnify:CR=1 FL=1